MFKGAAKLHEKHFDRDLNARGEIVTVRQPGARAAATNAVEKALGAQTFESAVGTTKDIIALWSNDLISPEAFKAGGASDVIAALGDSGSFDAVVRCKLVDALHNVSDRQGRTVFHTAKDVVYSGHRYKVTGTKRTGLPGSGPYILWVGLKLIPEDR